MQLDKCHKPLPQLPQTLYNNSSYKETMKCKVELYVAGPTFTEEVRAVDYQEAKRVALARNPNARVVSVTAVF